MNLEDLRHRSAATLSGGERQRALLGRALAQAAPILILDEPTNHLDLANQEQLLELIRDHTGTTIVAIHDLNLAAEYCDHIIVMADGSLVTTGTPDEVLTTDLLKDVFRVRSHVIPPSGERPPPHHHQCQRLPIARASRCKLGLRRLPFGECRVIALGTWRELPPALLVVGGGVMIALGWANPLLGWSLLGIPGRRHRPGWPVAGGPRGDGK
jgi:ABC-type antimicrobial peptide transport system ATPase subunit